MKVKINDSVIRRFNDHDAPASIYLNAKTSRVELVKFSDKKQQDYYRQTSRPEEYEVVRKVGTGVNIEKENVLKECLHILNKCKGERYE